MADYWGDLYAIFQNSLPPTNTAPPCYNEASFSFPNILQDTTGGISVTNCLYPLVLPPPTNTTAPCLASFTFYEKYNNEAFSFPNILQQPLTINSCLYPLVPPPPINTNTTPPSLDSFPFNTESFPFPINTNTTPPSLDSFPFNAEYYEQYSFPINTNTTLPSLASFNFNEEYSEALSFPNMVQKPLIITDEYADELDQMLAPYTTTTTTTTSSNNGIILNPNSLPDFAGQSPHLPPNPVLLAPPSKEPRPHIQKQQKQVFQVETSRALAKGRKSEQKKKVLHVTEDNKLSSDSWAWRKYGQKSIKGAPNPRKNKQMETVFYDELPSSDKWTWRKYGTKSIKGTPHPRNYFKCSSFKNCAARKWVQRSNSEAHKFIITYKGEHSHQDEAGFLLPSPFF